ncbi:U3 small nucleolar RNA-associated protein 13 [Rhodotorula toruloides]|uniref:BY PROTMAP: gi/472586778/gb/EMS24297.1/ U3 small nucleolar RNA-associated protein 13 [Rhodosporidium toruloides NP11] gi/647398191/emb/CDR41850.1/ RHTO0S06e07074g1_1 [Rhodosporidium toruloides] n=1 Tax=Rhodotorula toruloides TaxID=5286 RepID=A0A0K3CG26_RHOTO|nr:WD40-repeat-containing domain protein [Rhodotorula toruloides]
MSNPRPRFKTSFKDVKAYSPVHTGGKATLSGDGSWLVSTLNEQALVTDVETGEQIQEVKGDTSAVTTLAVTPSPFSPQDGGFLLTCCRSLAIHIYSLPSLDLHRHIPRAHDAPIITCCADPTGTLFATGSADGIVKVWDAAHGHCTHVFKGHGGVISAMVFDIASAGDGGKQGRARLITGADDCKIRVWDLRTREGLHVLDGHVSVVRGLDVTKDGKLLVSGGRDKVVNVWDLERGVLRKTMPVFETLEAIGLVEVPQSSDRKGKGKETDASRRKAVFTGGDKGVVRLWDLQTGEQIKTADETAGKVHEIVDVIHTPAISSLTAVYVDQNLVTRSLPSLTTTRQIIGFNDEVIDTCFLTPPTASSSSSDDVAFSPESQLAVATNSDLIRVYDLNRFNTSLLEGHDDVVLCLTRTADGQVLVSGSKDNTARVWAASANEEGETAWRCIGRAEGHVESVGAVATSKRDRHILVTASQDRTAKIWDLASLLSRPPSAEDGPSALRALSTTKIHDKDINSLDIAPNDKLLASGSQDRSAKLFAISYTAATKSTPASASLSLLGTFKGHKRGVWSVKFSPVDQILATASGDRTVKLWNLNDFTCVKTFEGHANSVLRVDFLTRGMQLVTAASDGLVKVWNVKEEECATTLDNHEEKVWALAVSKDEKYVVSGGADSVITVWEDVTETEELEKMQEQEELVLKEQDYENFLSMKDYTNAIMLALSMDQPRRLLNLFTEVRQTAGTSNSSTDPEADLASFTGSRHVDAVLQSLSPKEIRQLLGYIKDWNTVSRTAEVAQGVLHAILKFHDADKLLSYLEGKGDDGEDLLDLATAAEKEAGENEAEDDKDKGKKRKPKRAPEVKAADVLGALIPYTERHMTRADKLVRESFIVEHLLGMMEGFDDFDVEGQPNGMDVDGVDEEE